MPLVTKLGRDVTFPEGVPYISSYDPFDHVVLGDHVTNQKYYIYIYTLPQCLWLPNLAGQE